MASSEKTITDIVAEAMFTALRNTAPKGAYKAYCKKGGGLTFDGKPLPTWEELGADRQACWQAAAMQVATMTATAFKLGGDTLRGI